MDLVEHHGVGVEGTLDVIPPGENPLSAGWGVSVEYKINTNLQSALGETPSSYQLHFTIATAKANHHSVSHQYDREPPFPRSTPWGAYRSTSHFVQYT